VGPKVLTRPETEIAVALIVLHKLHSLHIVGK
jgi:hypothetical protein